MKVLPLAFMVLLALVREVGASGADGILCKAPYPFPSAPSPSAQVAQFAGELTAGDRYTATLWREPCGDGIPGGVVYIRFVPTAGDPKICGSTPTVLQDGLPHTVRMAADSDGPAQCEAIRSWLPTFVVEPRSFPYYKSDEAFTLVFRGDTQLSGATLPGFVAPGPITPQTGLWWNPAESGSGYSFDVKHGTLVVTVYSYLAFGAPIWYLASGPIVDDTFTAVLEKYVSGQCVSCAYKRPAYNGNDGTISIRFHSPTSAMMTLPGGRTIAVVPQEF